MTLIVAQKVGGEVYITGDTKCSSIPKDELKNGLEYIGGMKVILLHPSFCVAFAGDFLYAQDAIQGIFDKNVNLFNILDTLNYFLDHHINSISHQSATDFILVFNHPLVEDESKSETTLFRIEGGTVYNESGFTWIGDKSAFDEFQASALIERPDLPVEEIPDDTSGRTIHSIPFINKQILADGTTAFPNQGMKITFLGETDANLNQQFLENLNRSRLAMDHVISSSTARTVGGFETCVISDAKGLRYLETVSVFGTGRLVSDAPKSPLSFGGVAEGADVRYIGIGNSRLGLFAVYFETGRFCVIYNPERSFEPEKVPAENIEQAFDEFNKRLSVASSRLLAYEAKFLDNV